MSNTSNIDDTIMNKETLICELGKKLQAERERRKLSLEHVVENLKFNQSFLEALESGDWSAMPGEVYALGFLRQYAALLGISVDEDIQRIKTNHYELTKPLTYPDSPISPNRTWVVAAILLFIFINIVMNLFEVNDENKPEPTSTISLENSSLKKNMQPSMVPTESTLPVSLYNDAVVVGSFGASPESTLAKKTPLSKPATNIKPAVKAYVFFAASADVWLQIYQAQNNREPQLLREALLKVGESLLIESQEKILFTAGKPSALEVSMNGKIIFAQGSLGQDGKILKQYPINP